MPHLGVFFFFVQSGAASLRIALNKDIEGPRKLLLSRPRPVIGSARARPSVANRETSS